MLQDSDDSKLHLRDFEKVEIELDDIQIKDSIDFKELKLMDGYMSEDGEDSISVSFKYIYKVNPCYRNIFLFFIGTGI